MLPTYKATKNWGKDQPRNYQTQSYINIETECRKRKQHSEKRKLIAESSLELLNNELEGFQFCIAYKPQKQLF